MLTIGLSAGATHPEIDWPQRIERDDQIVQMLHQIRKAGIGAVTHINKLQGGTDTLEFHTEYTIALYRRGLYVPPLSPAEFFKMDEVIATTAQPPLPCWILVKVENIGVLESQPMDDYASLGMELARHIPDIHKQVKSPCKCKNYKNGAIYYVIQHLNDFHHPKKKVNGLRIRETWTREQIADWLDEVDADLTFDPDLPAKRAARRAEARQMMMLTSGTVQPSAMIKKISDDMAAVQPKIEDLQKGIVKLDVAIEEFVAKIHENLSKANQKCTCPACASKEES